MTVEAVIRGSDLLNSGRSHILKDPLVAPPPITKESWNHGDRLKKLFTHEGTDMIGVILSAEGVLSIVFHDRELIVVIDSDARLATAGTTAVRAIGQTYMKCLGMEADILGAQAEARMAKATR